MARFGAILFLDIAKTNNQTVEYSRSADPDKQSKYIRKDCEDDLGDDAAVAGPASAADDDGAAAAEGEPAAAVLPDAVAGGGGALEQQDGGARPQAVQGGAVIRRIRSRVLSC